MFSNIQYINVPGKKLTPQITVYALSTCGFCKRGLAWLNSQNFAYNYIYLDSIPFDVKNDIKKLLVDRFNVPVSFPYLVINEQEALVGFVEDDWKKKLEANQ